MRVIKLCHGPGNGVDQACLVTASNMVIGKGEDLDNNNCVCPIIQEFILRTNDSVPIERLGELYGDLVWEILGTNTENDHVELQRAYYLVSWAVRELGAAALDESGYPDEAKKCRSLPPIADKPSAAVMLNVVTDVYDLVVKRECGSLYEHGASLAHRTLGSVIHALRMAATLITPNSSCEHVVSSVVHAIHTVGEDSEGIDVWEQCPAVIRAIAAIGDKRPQEIVLTRDELCNALEAV